MSFLTRFISSISIWGNAHSKKLFSFFLLAILLFSSVHSELSQNIHLTKHKKKAEKKQKKKHSEKTANGPVKIYDCFTFFNEFELLEIRLNELYDVVDYFVLVEMDETFQGNPKRLMFKENYKRFEKFLDKIIYVPVTERIEVHNNPWEREKFQRDQIMRGLQNCNNQDVVLVSDLDEILSHHAIPRIVDALNHHWIVACKLDFFVYFLNAKENNDGGRRPYALRYRDLKGKSVDDLRKHYIFHIPTAPAQPPYIVYNAGWHFTSMGGLDRFVQKLDAWSHTPQNTPIITPEWRTQAFIDRSVQFSCHIVEIDQTFPKFVLDNLDALRKAGFIYE